MRLEGITGRTFALTAAAMVAFAANSLLCRLALGQDQIDAASFTSIRVGAGVVTLCLILLARSKRLALAPLNWKSVLGLAAYMVFFSFAYVSLHAGAGALILFGSVQITMFTVALRSGEHFAPLQWAGLALAVAGLVYLVSPGLAAPDPLGAALMAVAGMSWGVYSLVGRGATDPLAATTTNFLFTLPIVLAVSLITPSGVSLSSRVTSTISSRASDSSRLRSQPRPTDGGIRTVTCARNNASPDIGALVTPVSSSSMFTPCCARTREMSRMMPG